MVVLGVGRGFCAPKVNGAVLVVLEVLLVVAVLLLPKANTGGLVVGLFAGGVFGMVKEKDISAVLVRRKAPFTGVGPQSLMNKLLHSISISALYRCYIEWKTHFE